MVTQPRLSIFVCSPKRIANRVIHGTEYKFVFTKPEQIFGTMSHWVTKQEKVIVSDLERTIIDGLRRPEYCGGITEVAKGLWMRQTDLNFSKLVRYARRIKVGSVVRRLGYLEELYGLAKPDTLNELREELTRTYDILDPILPREGPYNGRWRLQLNVSADELNAVRGT
jgi:predicted transcriptional regulator of viral defense system